jgi:hypothetical protein
LSKGAPICLRSSLTARDREHLHFAEVAQVGGQLVTSGATGYVGVATGTGATVEDANAQALRVAHGVVVPNLRYRRDIGERVARSDLARLQSLGLVRLGRFAAHAPAAGDGVGGCARGIRMVPGSPSATGWSHWCTKTRESQNPCTSDARNGNSWKPERTRPWRPGPSLRRR